MTLSNHDFQQSAPFSTGLTAFVVALLLGGAAACFAASPYELDIKELERDAGPAKSQTGKAGKESKQRRGRVPADPGRPTAKDLEGEFISYTIRPGDHIYKVLTERFALSSEAAEELIPRILRVNGIRNVRGLQVGRTIRIPATVKQALQPPPVREGMDSALSKAAAPVPVSSAATPAATAKTESAPTQTNTPEESPPAEPRAAASLTAPAAEAPQTVSSSPPPLGKQKTVARVIPAAPPRGSGRFNHGCPFLPVEQGPSRDGPPGRQRGGFPDRACGSVFRSGG